MNGFELWFLKLQFTKKDRLRIYRKIAALTRGGIDIESALSTMYRHESREGKKPKRPTAVALKSWHTIVSNGKPLGRAMRSWIPQTDMVLIEAGEESGKLAEAFDNACFIAESTSRIRSAVIAGVTYPILLLFGAFALMGFFGTQVFPAFDDVWGRENWQGIAGQMAMLSDFVATGLLPVMGVLFAFGLAVFFSLPRWTGQVRRSADKLPPYSIYRLVNGSSFLLSMAAMINAGMRIPEALEVSLRNASPWMQERLRRILHHLRSGSDFGESLYRLNMDFPDVETVNDLRTYATLQDFDQAMDRIARANIDETVERITAQSKIMKNIGIILVGLVFAWIAVGLFTLQNQMLQALQNG